MFNVTSAEAATGVPFAQAVFAACARNLVAVEVNCQPERQDPPDDLIDVAAAAGCLFSIDTDAHAPGELAWLSDGCERLAAHGVDPERVVHATGTSMAAPQVIPEVEWRRRERENIRAALQIANGRIYGSAGAAETLGLKPTTLISRMKAPGLRGEAVAK